MRQTRPRWLVCLMLGLIVFTMFPNVVMAEQSQVSLEQAIQTVKQNLTIPSEYTDFVSQFNSSEGNQTWTLHWTSPSNDGQSLNATVDADTGEIVAMNSWRREIDQAQYTIPQISKEEARKIGEKFLQRIIPKRMSTMYAIEGYNQVIPLSSYGPATYSLSWERQTQGVPVSGDGASVNVNMVTGEIINYNLNWTKIDFPAPAGVLSGEAARQAFEKAGILQLQYLLPVNEKNEKKAPILVYRINDSSNGKIDAVTGTPLELEYGQWLRESMADYDSMGMVGGKGDSMNKSPLSPEETLEVEKSAKLISQDDAVAAIKKWLDISSSLSLSYANLEKDWRNPDKRIWNINWQSSRTDSKIGGSYIGARVDAQTGEMISFNMDSPHMIVSSSNKLTREAAQKMAEKYVQGHEARYSQVKINPNTNRYNGSNEDSYWRFSYQRVVNGIVCPGNGIEVGVDTINKRINSYEINWTDQEFPAINDPLEVTEANQIYLRESPLKLMYCLLFNQDGTKQVKVAYQPRSVLPQNDTGVIDAKTGERLDQSGKAISEQTRPYTYNDIQDYFGAREISLLGQAGIMGEYKDSFHPQENVKLVSLLRAMLGTQNGIWAMNNADDQEVMKQARNRGWLKEDLDPAAVVNRELLTRLLVRYLGVEYIAKLGNIYQVPFDDLNEQSGDLGGYATLAWGLGIIKGNGSGFEAEHVISRGEAAVALVRTLGARASTERPAP